jgi:hypothetical protein
MYSHALIAAPVSVQAVQEAIFYMSQAHEIYFIQQDCISGMQLFPTSNWLLMARSPLHTHSGVRSPSHVSKQSMRSCAQI